MVTAGHDGDGDPPGTLRRRVSGHDGDGDPLGAMRATAGHSGNGDPQVLQVTALSLQKNPAMMRWFQPRDFKFFILVRP